MSEETYDAAYAAFASLDSEGEQNPQGVADAPGEKPESTPEAPESQPDLPASKEVDLSGLTEEQQIFLRAREREMQADYTRKTQELAEQRREAEMAMQFVQALNSDPDFANSVLLRLQQGLAQSGYQQSDDYAGEEYDEYDMQQEPDSRDRELAEMRQWREQIEEQWAVAAAEAHLDRQLADIRVAHPDWTQEDLQTIVDLGFATNGDLMKAAELYQAHNDRVLSRYINSKKSTNAPGVLPNTSGSVSPPDLAEATDKELRNAALERILNAMAE